MSLEGITAKQIAKNSGNEVNTVLMISILAMAFGAFLIYTGYRGLKTQEATLKLGVKLQGSKAGMFNKFKIGFGVLVIIKFALMLGDYFL